MTPLICRTPRWSRALCAGLLLVPLAGFGTPSHAAASAEARVVSRERDTVATVADTAVVAGPLHVFADIEDAWRHSDVDRILSHFGRSKVRISVIGTGPSGGSFSRSQSYYLLRDLFKYTTTQHFEFVQFRTSDEDERTPFAIAERHYQRTDDGRLYKDKIYISLHRAGRGKSARWVIDEIKSIR